MILVVGATGQLGTAVVRKAIAAGKHVRAFVRPMSDFEHLRQDGVELCFGDLRDPESLREACEGVEAVIATATVVFPRGRYRFDHDEGAGYQNLLTACRDSGVNQFLFTSVIRLPHRYASRVPTLRLKGVIEDIAKESGVSYTIFRAGAFMDDYFALIGSSIPLRGAEAATLRRPYWFSNLYLRHSGTMIENRGIALIPGNVGLRHSFIALDDVATFLIRAVGHPAAANQCFDIGGPERLSWGEVLAIYAKLLGRPVRGIPLRPPWVLRWLSTLLRPFSEAASNQLGILWSLAEQEITVASERVAELFNIRLTSAEEFLRAKLALPPDS
jgi:uncharacterized protein YbjT (DUF2867 family)